MPEFADNNQGSRFKPGQSGNPAGKPPGTRSKVLAELDRLGAEGAQKVLEAVLDAAQRGDMTAASIILKRCWPEFRGRPVRLELPGTNHCDRYVTALAAMVSAVAGAAFHRRRAKQCRPSSRLSVARWRWSSLPRVSRRWRRTPVRDESDDPPCQAREASTANRSRAAAENDCLH
jgi:Family of unknown function (DUF5681)